MKENKKASFTEEEIKQANAARAAYYREYRKSARGKESLKDAAIRYWLKKAQGSNNNTPE